MNNLKRIVMSKNFITIVLLLVGLVVLYIGYDMTIKKETNPIRVPVATRTINPTEQITEEDITWKTVPSAAVSENVLQHDILITGNYANINVTIPEGSMFYEEWVIGKNDLPGKWVELVEKGEVPYYFPVSITSTLGNSVLPDTYIDVYLKIEDENGTVMFGKFLDNIKILAVHDSNGKNVFGNAEEIGNPSYIGFGVTSELYLLLKKAEYLGLEFTISPRGQTPPTYDYIVVKSETLKEYIESKTIMVPEDEILKETEKENGTNNNQNGEVVPNEQNNQGTQQVTPQDNNSTVVQ